MIVAVALQSVIIVIIGCSLDIILRMKIHTMPASSRVFRTAAAAGIAALALTGTAVVPATAEDQRVCESSPIAVSEAAQSPESSTAAAMPSWKAALVEGRKFMQLQEFEKAERCFRIAVKDAIRNQASVDDIAECREALGDALEQYDHSPEAKSQYKKALKVLTKAYGTESPKLILPLLALGSVWETDLEFKHAITVYKRAADIAGKSLGMDTITFIGCQHRLARTIANSGLYKQAEPMFMMCLSSAITRQKLPSPQLLQAILDDYKDLLRKNGAPRKSLQSKFQLAIMNDNLSEQKTQGVPASEFEKEVRAELTGTRLEANAQGAVSPTDPEVVQPELPSLGLVSTRLPRMPIQAQKFEITVGLNDLAFEYFCQEKYAESAKIYQWALADCVLCFGSQSPLTAASLTDYSSFLKRFGRDIEAADALATAQRIEDEQPTR